MQALFAPKWAQIQLFLSTGRRWIMIWNLRNVHNLVTVDWIQYESIATKNCMGSFKMHHASNAISPWAFPTFLYFHISENQSTQKYSLHAWTLTQWTEHTQIIRIRVGIYKLRGEIPIHWCPDKLYFLSTKY